MKATPIHDRIPELWEQWARDRKSSRKVIMPGEVEVFPFWSHSANATVPWRKTEPSNVSPVMVVSVYYQTDGVPDVWHQTDRAFTIGRRTDTLIQDYIMKTDTPLGADQLVARAYSANLAD